MVTGWKQLQGKWYYFHGDGTMAASEWISGYWLGKNGAWNYPHRAGWHKARKGWWYGDDSGWYARNASYRINGVEYAFDKDGYVR